jgi:hypothetical protein
MSNGNIVAFHCTSIGVAGTTRVFVKEIGPMKFEARVGIAIMGSTNRNDDGLALANPFDEDFHDNYAKGEGATRELALEALKLDMKKIADDIWL